MNITDFKFHMIKNRDFNVTILPQRFSTMYIQVTVNTEQSH